MKAVRKLIENKAIDGETTECSKILGDLSKVYILADFWESHSEIIELITANGLLDYISGDIDSKQFAAFKTGIGYMGVFMANCSGERKFIENQKLKTANSSPTEGS